MSALRIVPMSLADIPSVLEIERSSQEDPWGEELFVEELSRSCSYTYVAQLTERGASPRVVGFVCFWKVVDEIHIHNLAVHSAYRRRGIGRSLLLHTVKRGCELGGQVVLLEVSQANEAAQRLYKSVGFHSVGQRPRYYGEGAGKGAVLMDLEIAVSREAGHQ